MMVRLTVEISLDASALEEALAEMTKALEHPAMTQERITDIISRLEAGSDFGVISGDLDGDVFVLRPGGALEDCMRQIREWTA